MGLRGLDHDMHTLLFEIIFSKYLQIIKRSLYNLVIDNISS